jgi:hypothetical protein
MRLLFSEYKSDYGHYVFPYAVWAVPEPGETPADLFEQGFLPSSRNLDRFYLCRQVRVATQRFRLTSENRRILRKCQGIGFQCVPRADFEYTAARRQFCKTYADTRFGAEVMPWERLDGLFNSPITSHLLVFTDAATGAEVGLVTLYREARRMGFYYYAFYDLAYYRRSLGLHMMTCAVEFFARELVPYLFLGSCYLPNARYKTQFVGAEFFNGFRWSDNLKELKYLIERDAQAVDQHLLETDRFRREFYADDFSAMVAAARFRVNVPPAER